MNLKFTVPTKESRTTCDCVDKYGDPLAKRRHRKLKRVHMHLNNLIHILSRRCADRHDKTASCSIAAFPGAGKSYLVDYVKTRRVSGTSVIDLDYGELIENKILSSLEFKSNISIYDHIIYLLKKDPNKSIVFINEPRAGGNMYFIPFPDETTKSAGLARIAKRDNATSSLYTRMKANFFSGIDGGCKSAEENGASVVFMKANDDNKLITLGDIIFESKDKLVIESSCSLVASIDNVANGVVCSLK